jgi:hypothetical protein
MFLLVNEIKHLNINASSISFSTFIRFIIYIKKQKKKADI